MDDLKNLKNKWTFDPNFNAHEVSFSAKLVNVAENAIENKNGKKFHPSTIAMLVNGVPTNYSGVMYEKTLQNLNELGGPEYGKDYLCRGSVRQDEIELAAKENRPVNIFITVSQLQGASRANGNDFGFDAAATFKDKGEFATTGANVKEEVF